MRSAPKVVLAVAAVLLGSHCDSAPDSDPSGQAGWAAEEAPGSSSVLTERLAEEAFKGNTKAVEAMLPSVDVDATDQDGRTMLMLAAYNGNSTTVRLLCENQANPNLRDSERRTALMYASSGPNAHTVEILLAHGAEVNVTDGAEGYTALMFAAGEGHADIVKMLIDRGANPGLLDIDGDSALAFAQQNGHTDVVALLSGASGRN